MKGLYLVTPDWDNTQQLLEISELALRGGATVLQYRHKTADAALRREQAECLQALCRTYSVPFVINDHLDLCLALDADGIHVGGTDMTVAEVRARVGPQKIVGASCYGSMDLARAAHHAGASYVAFGGFYPSRVKKYEVSTQPSIVAEAKAEIPLPVVVIGGMTRDNAVPLVAQGADMVAVISSVYQAGNPQSAARGFADLFISG
ncbi:MAG TPA: thiamine phosphate synthase [Burkholderiaceae bacterium]